MPISKQKGFGLIVLLISFAIIAWLATKGIKTYYGKHAVVDDTGKEVEYKSTIDYAEQARDMIEHNSQETAKSLNP
jgi:Tfp pilus assembly major pilin PilA